MSGITTHVLDTSLGRPAAGLPVLLEREEPDGRFVIVSRGCTDEDGRCRGLLPAGAPLLVGTYRLQFDTAAYFRVTSRTAFYPRVSVTFAIANAAEHFHVPLLLAPFGYSTYRGT